jgi:threonyl-tRNA synthetase
VRILSIHADRMWYHATRKTKIAEPTDVPEDRMVECVVLFCCVEKLDEKNPDHVIRSARQNILSRLSQLKVDRVMIYPYAHLTSTLGSPAIALMILSGLEAALRSAMLEVKRAPFGWYKEFEIRGKGHPLADLSMTICPYERTECDFSCPYCHHPINKSDARQTQSGPDQRSCPESETPQEPGKVPQITRKQA